MRCVLFATAAFCTTIWMSALPAQGQSALQEFQKKVDDSLPKGRFLKRLRDEIRGTNDDDDDKKKSEKQPTAAKRLNAPTPAKASTATNPNYSQSQTAQGKYAREPTAEHPQFELNPPKTSRQDIAAIGTGANANLALQIDSLSNKQKSGAAKDTPVGFGLVLDVKGETVVVVDVDRKGNAHEAGVRKGDVVESIGGMPIHTIDEFDQIANVMKNGDQIEMGIGRRGKTDTVNVIFGEAVPLSNSFLDDANSAVSNSSAPSIAPRQMVDNDDGFAPPPMSVTESRHVDGLQSVLNSDFGSSSSDGLPMTDNAINDVNVLKTIIEQQQQQIDSLRKELDSIRQRSSQKKSFDPPLGI